MVEPEPEVEKPKKTNKVSAEVPDNCHTIITPKSAMKKPTEQSSKKSAEQSSKKSAEQPKTTTKKVTTKTQEEDIDITKYRTITIGDDEDDQQRYGCLKTANMDSKFKIYKVANYVGPKNFKIVSSKPIGTYDPENDELTLNEE